MTLLRIIIVLFLYSYFYSYSRSASKRPKNQADDDDEEEEDLTADMEDPTPENSITEVKVTAANAGKSDMQPSKSGVASTYMDVDEAQEAQKGGKTEKEDEEETEDNVTEQTHHIIVPSYRYINMISYI